MTGVGSSPALATCETSQVLLAGVSGGFSRGSPVFAPPTDWPVSYVASGSGEEGSSEFSLTKEKFSFFICVYNCLDFSLG